MAKTPIGAKRTLLIICFIFLISCNQREKQKSKLHFTQKDKWVEDSLGCLGNRERIVTDSLSFIESYIGFNRNVFIENFGVPNYKIERQDGRVLLQYLISCGLAPVRKGIDNDTYQVYTEASIMMVEIDTNNTIQEIWLAMP